MHDSYVAKCYTKLGTVYLSKAGGSEYAVTLFLGEKPLSRQHCSSLEEGLEVFADKVQRKIRLAEREEGHGGVAQGTDNERGGEGV